eukprot:1158205-Pelagomonas_calceolata.AAC.4
MHAAMAAIAMVCSQMGGTFVVTRPLHLKRFLRGSDELQDLDALGADLRRRQVRGAATVWQVKHFYAPSETNDDVQEADLRLMWDPGPCSSS